MCSTGLKLISKESQYWWIKSVRILQKIFRSIPLPLRKFSIHGSNEYFPTIFNTISQLEHYISQWRLSWETGLFSNSVTANRRFSSSSVSITLASTTHSLLLKHLICFSYEMWSSSCINFGNIFVFLFHDISDLDFITAVCTYALSSPMDTQK